MRAWQCREASLCTCAVSPMHGRMFCRCLVSQSIRHAAMHRGHRTCARACFPVDCATRHQQNMRPCRGEHTAAQCNGPWWHKPWGGGMVCRRPALAGQRPTTHMTRHSPPAGNGEDGEPPNTHLVSCTFFSRGSRNWYPHTSRPNTCLWGVPFALVPVWPAGGKRRCGFALGWYV